MVWGLFPVDPLSGENLYHIFSKGTYKVGRKGCDIIIDKDKGVSRIHAEIIIDEMICMDHLEKKASKLSSKVRIRDCSKYGTFINKNLDFKENVHEFPNKEVLLKNGDLVSFGTGSATYRFSFVPLVFFKCSSKPSEMKQLEEKISSIGACMSQNWTSQCTHMVVDDFIPVTHQIIDAVVAKKSIIQFSWIELIAGKTICTEIPSSLSYSPSLMLEGIHVKVTDPRSREQCLRRYTFLLESLQKYKFKEKLQLLLDVGGAEVVLVETLDDIKSLGEKTGHLVCVLPTGSTNTRSFHNFSSVTSVKELELISAVFSGHLDPSMIISAPVVVTSSCSTDETVVADSDVDMETVTSIRKSTVVDLIGSADNSSKEKITIHKVELAESDCQAGPAVHAVESFGRNSGQNTVVVKSIDHESQGFIPPTRDPDHPDSSCSNPAKSNTVAATFSRDRKDGDALRMAKTENLDIIFSQDLIAREYTPLSHHSSTDGVAINFKRFRKMDVPSGNSFNNLVPFAKYPYHEADYGNEDVAESIKSEKKRKQMETIAEDLFNYEKGRKRGTAAALRGVFARN
ncbi:nibrin homolog isoform X1 [Primulina eburnea]|uniref:nibrin homolog isoform X1 n=1 Tax=Primulina eburnea TaxID=1245227 RepID=UPI003C6C1830